MAAENKFGRNWLGLLTALLLGSLAGCASQAPSSSDNICDIFSEKRGWLRAAWGAEKKWGTPIPVSLAIIHQESSFVHNVRPKKKRRFLGISVRDGSSMGYSQATKETWQTFQKQTKKPHATRKSFKDSVYFIGWYNRKSERRNKIALDDPYHLYIAYHEGHSGYRSAKWHAKSGLIQVAKKVGRRARLYDNQLASCTPRRMKKRKRL